MIDNYSNDFSRLLHEAFTEKEIDSVWGWAEKHRIMAKGVTAKPGRFSIDNTPFAKEPSEAIDDPDIHTVVYMCAARMFKTTTIENFMGRTIHQDQHYILSCLPTDSSCKKFRKKQFNPMIRSSPVLRPLINLNRRSKDTEENEMLSVFFGNGNISWIGSNSTAGFRQVQAPTVIADEIDDYEDTDDGDTIELLESRADNYDNSRQIYASTPTIKGESRIEALYEKSDKRRYYVKSPHCDEWFIIGWEHFHIPKGEDGHTDRERLDESTLICPFTKKPITEEQRVEAVLNGQWRKTGTGKGIAGFHINAMNSIFPAKKGFKNKYHQWAHNFLKAYDKGPSAIKVWTNLFLAETYEEESEVFEEDEFMNRREDYNKIPSRACVVTAAIDVQGDRFEIEFEAWGDNYESWGLDYIVLPLAYSDPKCVDALYDILSKKYEHEFGFKLGLDLALIDVGWQGTEVYKIIAKLRDRGINIQAVKGKGTQGHNRPDMVPPQPSFRNKAKQATWNVGTDETKDWFFSSIRLEEGTGVVHWSSDEGLGYDRAYFSSLLAERRVTKHSYGKPYSTFIKRKGYIRNEALDLKVYNIAAAHILAPKFKSILKRMKPVVKDPIKDVSKPKNAAKSRVRKVNRIRRMR